MDSLRNSSGVVVGAVQTSSHLVRLLHLQLEVRPLHRFNHYLHCTELDSAGGRIKTRHQEIYLRACDPPFANNYHSRVCYPAPELQRCNHYLIERKRQT